MEILLLLLSIGCAVLYRNNRKYRRIVSSLSLSGAHHRIDEALSGKLSNINWHDAFASRGMQPLKIATCSAMFGALGKREEARELSQYAWDGLENVVGFAFTSLPSEVSISPHAVYAIDAGVNSYLNGYIRGYSVCFGMMLETIEDASSVEQAGKFRDQLMAGAQDMLHALRANAT